MASLTKIRYPIVESINPSQINAGGATNGQLLSYNVSSGQWTPTTVTVSPSSITSGGASNGQVMTWNGTSWVPVTPSNVTSALNGGSLIGSVAYFAMSTAPQGWLVCDGRQLDRTSSNSMYNALFLQIGYTFGGTGDLFNLPDLRGEFIRGWDNSRGIDSGRTFGSNQADEFKSHTHQAKGINLLTGSSNAFWWSDSNEGSATKNTMATGGSETRPRNVALLPCICYASMFNGIPVGPAGGDLASAYPNPTVAKIQGNSVSSTAPSINQVLSWSGSAWTPTTVTGKVLKLQELQPTSGNGGYPKNSFCCIDTEKRARMCGHTGYGKFGTRDVWGTFGILGLPNNEKAKKVFNFAVTVFILTESGKVYSSGYNGTGICGVGSTTDVKAPTLVASLPTTVTEIWCNDEHDSEVSIYALCTDGRLYAWGYNQYGMLGTRNETQYNSPQLTLGPGNTFSNPTTQVIQVVPIGGWDGRNHPVAVAALLSDGTVWCVGYGGTGSIGNGTTTTTNYWQRVETSSGTPLTGITKIGGGGYDAQITFYALKNDGKMYSWGANNGGEAGLGHSNNVLRPTQMSTVNMTNSFVVDFWAATTHVQFIFVKTVDGAIYGCGRNNNGNLGLGDTTNRNILTKITSLNGYTVDYMRLSTQNSVGKAIAVVSNSSTVQMLAAGYNGYGELGLGTESDAVTTFTPIPFYADPGIADVRVISRHGNVSQFTVILTKDGETYAMGYNEYNMFSSPDTYTVFPKRVTTQMTGS